ncbi:MAG: hypothetical protein ACYCS9_00225 [Candidatus Dormibacteria bacterium]
MPRIPSPSHIPRAAWLALVVGCALALSLLLSPNLTVRPSSVPPSVRLGSSSPSATSSPLTRVSVAGEPVETVTPPAPVITVPTPESTEGKGGCPGGDSCSGNDG